MQRMHRLTRRPLVTLLQLGWIIFGLGVIWDLVYHATLLMISTPLSSTVDLIGSFGHVVTFGGTVLIIFALLRRHST